MTIFQYPQCFLTSNSFLPFFNQGTLFRFPAIRASPLGDILSQLRRIGPALNLPTLPLLTLYEANRQYSHKQNRASKDRGVVCVPLDYCAEDCVLSCMDVSAVTRLKWVLITKYTVGHSMCDDWKDSMYLIVDNLFILCHRPISQEVVLLYQKILPGTINLENS